MSEQLQHPDIEMALKTGYPSWKQPQPIYCDNCGEEINDSDEVYTDRFHEYLCLDCLKRLHTKGWW